jgi:hypothetical protein
VAKPKKSKFARLAIDALANGKLRPAADVTLLGEDGSVLGTDRGDLRSYAGRKKVVRNLARQTGAQPTTIDNRLTEAWNKVMQQHRAQQSQQGEGGGEPGQAPVRARLSQADKLVLLAGGLNLFHSPGGCDSEGYVTVPVKDHHENWPVSSKGFRRWLGKCYYDTFENAPSSQAMQDALNVISGRAIHEGPDYPVAVRVAEQNGEIYLDLADATGGAVRIGPKGWSVVRDCPVKFVRRRGMLPLPEPARGGSVQELRRLVNVAHEESWALLVAALRPGRPFPVLVVNGEHGSAKTTLCRMARGVIDPNVADLPRPPRDVRDLMIAATNSWIVGYDNLSGISRELSDSLCCLATRGAFGTRELYSDDEEKLFDATRPVIVNGIEDIVTQSDLMDRSITLSLPTIDDKERLLEAQLWSGYEEVRPRVLGALLDTVSAALANYPAVRLAATPRMADFAHWAVAAEGALGLPTGQFLEAYVGNRKAANQATLENDMIAPFLLSFLDGENCWKGTARELLRILEDRYADEKTKKSKEWPWGPRQLSGALRRIAPNLRADGVKVEFDREAGGKRQRTIYLEKSCKSPSRPSPLSPITEKWSSGRDDRDGNPFSTQADRPDRPKTQPSHELDLIANGDGRDGRDGDLQDFSGDGHGDAWEGD